MILGLTLGLARPTVSGPAAIPFLPSDIASVVSWWDASDTSTIATSGATVTSIANRIGGAPAATEVGAGPSQTTIGGLNALSFDSQSLRFTAQDTRAALVVFANSTGSGGPSGNASVSPVLGNSTRNIEAFFRPNAAGADISVDGSVGQTGFASVNGGAVSSGTNINLGFDNANFVDPNLFYFGWDAIEAMDSLAEMRGGNILGKIDIGELVLLDAVPSLTDRQKLEGYLAHKWGIEGKLAAGHPFLSAPPE